MDRIKTVKVLRDYSLEVQFEDGVKGTVDLSHLVGKGVFQSWKDRKEFEKVTIDPACHTLAWPGDIDLAPEVLYEEICKQKAA